MRDTTPEAEQAWLDAIRRMEPVERLRRALEFSDTVREVALTRLRGQYPGRSDLELVELMLGTTLIPREKRLPRGP